MQLKKRDIQKKFQKLELISRYDYIKIIKEKGYL